MLLEQFFHIGFPQELSLAVFTVRSYLAGSKQEVMDIIRRHLRRGGKILHNVHSCFTIAGTGLKVRQLVLFVAFDTNPTVAELNELAKSIAADRPIISAIHCRSWNISAIQPAPTIASIDPVLTDAEARTIGIQHPDILTRSWFGRDKDGRSVLRTAIVGSKDEVDARSALSDSGDGEDATPAAAGPAAVPAAGASVPRFDAKGLRFDGGDGSSSSSSAAAGAASSSSAMAP
jgi:hypothetical protein